MNAVYLILAHKSPAQLYRLIKSLRNSTTIFVVHVDIAVSLSIFLDLFLEMDDVKFIEKRSRTSWGSFEIIDATLTSLQYIKENLPGTDRVTLLSGQDYPIKPAKQIFSYFNANRDTIFMEHFPLPVKKWYMGGASRFPNFDAMRDQLYAGSQWWSFPMKVVELILSILKDYPSFIDYFKKVIVPDESFFQTLLLNSEEPIIVNNLSKENLSFIKWHFPYSHARTILSKDFTLLIKSNKFFARKFDESIDPKVLDMIDGIVMNTVEYRSYKKKCRSSMPRLRQAIAMLTNKATCLLQYQNLTEELPDKAVPFLLYHDVDNKIDKNLILNAKNLFSFDDTVLSNLGFTPIEPSLLPGSNHFPLFSLYNSRPDFDYYWLIEDDVYYNGKWKDFFDEFSPERVRADFVSCYIRTRNEEPNWYWWNSLAKDNSKEIVDKIASFNPIYRISKEALIYLDGQLKKGWVGHHEVLIPTLLYEAGFTLRDFGGNGAFCPPHKKNKIYASVINGNKATCNTGSMRDRPVIQQDEIKEKLLYHPVKFNLQ